VAGQFENGVVAVRLRPSSSAPQEGAKASMGAQLAGAAAAEIGICPPFE
jgi:hypothetical protein